MKPLAPEVVEKTEDLERVRKLARMMDDLVEIPGTGFRVGLDGILGLIPGLGDISTLFASSYIIFIAAKLRVSAPVLARMFLNMLIDSLLSAVPLLGDIFDFVWKANRKNLVLLERHLEEPQTTKRRSTWLLAAIFIGGVAALVAVMTLVVSLIWTLLAWLMAHASN